MLTRLAVVVLAACGGSSAPPAAPSHQAPVDSCASAFAGYQKAWHLALAEEIGSDDGPAFAEAMTDSLPTRKELAKIREVHTLGNGKGSSDSPAWVSAWAATEHAIDRCGEGAKP